MPELPEVETVCRSLRKHIIGRTITSVVVRSDTVIRQGGGNAEGFQERLLSESVEKIERRGKYIVFVLSTCWLVCHLRMTGKLLARAADYHLGKHDHVVFELEDGQRLVYEDVRRFGGFYLSEESPYLSSPLSKIGPEPLEDVFNTDYFWKSMRQRQRPIKSHLLDQSVVAGIGNIYADEILFRAGIRPRKSSMRLSRREALLLVEATKYILQKAIEAGGSTIRDYVDSDNKTGAYQLSHQVYGRAGKPCLHCGAVLKSVVVGGRSSVYCPKCQKS